ncbi:hypothetical protein JKF63_05100 [Porcisia hertigi]|uniref:Uncharacterized protein n=1 Tax=Porcisia hertigi TaxID=2761500 RepID=A0A836IAA6_9TRYP|nr:hypothetical protein JKF63_05100 [Porcisia hertigi]
MSTMFTRVGAFLEAIDKKTERLANAADEEDLARAAKEQHIRLQFDSKVSSTTSLKPRPQPAQHTPKGNGGSFLDGNLQGGLAHGCRSTAGDGGSSFPSTEPPHSTMASSAHLASGEKYTVDHVPLSLPTKLPSYRPSLQDVATDSGRKGVAAGLNRSLTSTAGAGPSAGNVLDPSQGNVVMALSDATRTRAGHVATSSTAAAAVERLEARCKVLEAENVRWRQEAATNRAQCSAARDSLWKVEQDARAGRAAQRAAEEALIVYKETSQRLLNEAQQEVKRARDAAAGLASATGPQQQTDASHEARELHQQLELLQADHALLSAEVERHRQEAAKVAAELQRAQEKNREMQVRVDDLEFELGAARESLEGEVVAHAEARSDLRRLQAQKSKAVEVNGNPPVSAAVTHGTGEAGPAASLAQLQSELCELKQRNQILSLQASNRQAALDAAVREAVDMKARYNELAKQMQDAEVEVAAGFRGPPTASSMCGHRVFGPRGSGVSGNSADAGAHWAHDDKVAVITTDNSADARRRNPAMVRLARQYGVVGRVIASVLCTVDGVAVQVGCILTHASWVWRVALMGYIGLLQIWVVLMIVGTLVLEDKRCVLEGDEAARTHVR